MTQDLLKALSDHPNFDYNHLVLDKTYTYSILTKKHIDQVVEVFTKSFCRSEPMTHYLQMDEDKYRIFARAVAEKAAADQLSIVALDEDKVIACALVEDVADTGAIPDFDPKFENIVALLDSLGKPFFTDKKITKKQIAHLFITAVDQNYRHQELSIQVNFHAMDIALKNHFKYVYCEFTHPYNEKGVLHHLRNKKKIIGSCVYKEFILNGIKPFERLVGGANSYLWETNPKTVRSVTSKMKTHSDIF